MKRTVLMATAVWLAPAVVLAHGGLPSIAPIEAPRGVGHVVDDRFEVRWTDLDLPVPTGTATVDLHYTGARPTTFAVGEIPPDLTGTTIVRGILEKDTTNRYTWDTTAVPSGSYWVWSFVNEPPTERDPFPVVSFSPGVVTVAHPGDDVRPAIILTSPETPYDYANQSYVVRFEAFDPDGTGTVVIEAAHGGDRVTIADGIAAASNGEVIWETAALAEGDWVLSATVADARGYSFTSFGSDPVWITHRVRPGEDAGVADAKADETPVPRAMTNEGCRCVRAPPPVWGLWLPLLLILTRPKEKRSRTPGSC